MSSTEMQRLRWQCRRGMLELDLLLGRFLEESYASLDEAQQQAFARLLQESDQDLQGWLLGETQPVDTDLNNLVKKILQHTVIK
jgi:antitoxin CptB